MKNLSFLSCLKTHSLCIESNKFFSYRKASIKINLEKRKDAVIFQLKFSLIKIQKTFYSISTPNENFKA